MSRSARRSASPRPAEPAAALHRPEDRDAAGGPSRVDIALACLWIMTLCVQYVGSYLRTGVQLEVASGLRSDLNLQGFDRLALWDLTPLYALLLVATVVRVTLRVLAGRRPER